MNENELKILFGKQIKNIRKNRHFTQEKLAEMIGIEPANLSKMENGTHFPTIKNLVKLANILEVEVAEFFNFSTRENAKSLKSLNLQLSRLNEKQIQFISEIIDSLEKLTN